MDRFKAIIREALNNQAAKLSLTLGQVPEVYSIQNQQSQLSQFGENDYGWLANTHKFLFNMPPEPHQPVAKEGSLNIPSLGKLLVLVQPKPAFTLCLYFPGAKGNELFEQDKNPQKSIDLDSLAQTDAVVQNDPYDMSTPPTSPYEKHSGDAISFVSEGVDDANPPLTPQNPLQDTVDEKMSPPPPAPEPNPSSGGTAAPEDIFSIGDMGKPDSSASEDELYSLGGLHSQVEGTPESTSNEVSDIPVGVGNSDFGSSAAPDLFGTVVADNKSQPPSPPIPQGIPPDQPMGLGSTQVAKQLEPSPEASTDLGVGIDPFAEPVPEPEPVNVPPPPVSAPSPSHSKVVSQPTPVAMQSTPPEPDNQEIEFGKPKDGSLSSLSNKQFPIDHLLKDMVSKGSSDLHLTIGQPIIFRIDGDVRRTKNPPLTPEEMKNLLDPMIPSSNRNEFIEGNDTDFAYYVPNVGRFRVNIFRNQNGVGSVMRHIPDKILTAEQLGLPAPMLKFANLHKGLVLVTGPTGSGKSTTLAAIIDRINKTRKDHILTIEDPIEFVHENQSCLVNQREIGIHTKSFGRALRAALREDPDIVLIGEMRDLETVHIAIETAETGHLVFGTLHTTTAISTIDRIIDQFPAEQQEQIRTMLASSLKGVVAQTLLKKKGGGRVAAHEILIPDDAVQAMIRKGDVHMIKSHMQTQKAAGNALLNETLLNLVREGTVELQEAFSKAVKRKEFLEMAPRFGVNVKDLTP